MLSFVLQYKSRNIKHQFQVSGTYAGERKLATWKTTRICESIIIFNGWDWAAWLESYLKVVLLHNLHFQLLLNGKVLVCDTFLYLCLEHIQHKVLLSNNFPLSPHDSLCLVRPRSWSVPVKDMWPRSQSWWSDFLLGRENWEDVMVIQNIW